MGGKQRPAAVHLVQVFQRGPGDRKPVIGRRPAPDLVQDHQRPVIRLIQDRRRLDHLDHEGRPPPRQIVGRADPAEQLADQPDPGRGRRHMTARLRQKGDQGVLPQEGGFPRHVRPGQQPDRRGLPVGQRAVIGDEGASPCRRKARSTTGCRPPVISKARLSSTSGSAPAFIDGKIGERGGKIDLGQARAAWAMGADASRIPAFRLS
jgi:hypothetical protein